uniref:U4/U6.U5 tri-snRNP-associated protein 1 n=1 Tax=Candidozyma auris TaxID=498019 RepID=A0A0L0NUL7_CANAR
MTEEISLSVEETNKLRAQLGLKLLPVEKDPRKNHEGEVVKLELSLEETNKLRASLGLRPIVRETEEKISSGGDHGTSKEEKGHGGQLESTSAIDTSSKLFYNEADPDWLNKVGKNSQRDQNVTAVAKQTEDADQPDLEVAHSTLALRDLKDGEVFTLEDQSILDDGRERILNEKISKAEKLRRDEREKAKAAILKFGARFDYEEEEDEEPEEFAQVIGSTIVMEDVSKSVKPEKNDVADAGALFDDLDEEQPVKMKKFKKKMPKKNKGQAKKRVLEDDHVTDVQPMVTVELKLDEGDEEEDIDLILAQNRQKRQKKRKHLTPEQIAQEIQLHKRIDRIERSNGIVFDDTAEFLNSIGEKAKESKQPVEDNGDEAREHNDDLIDAGAGSNEIENVPLTSRDTTSEPTGTSSTPTFGSMASTLEYLRKNRAVKVELAEEKETRKRQEQRVKEAEIQRIAISIEERTVRQELERDPSYKRLTKEEQESTFDRVLNERLIAKGLVETPKSRYPGREDRLSDYSPQVQLQYKDKEGNQLDQKQAWKQLSHRYHGTAPKHKKRKPVSKSEQEHVVG